MRNDLWTLAASNLRPKDQDSLKELQGNTPRVEDIVSAAEERKKECKDRQWELKRSKGKDAIVLRDVFSKISVWLQKLVEVGDVAVNYDPGHAALPWAGIRFLLKVSIQDVQQYAAVTEGVERMTKLIVRFRIVEKLSQKGRHEASKQLETSLIELYTSIWSYILKAYRYFGRNTAMRALRSMTTFLDKFVETNEAINKHEAEADKWFETIAAERSDDIEGSLDNLTLEERESHQRLLTLLDDLSKPIKRMEAELKDVHDWLSAEGKLNILQWISPLPYQQYHIQASNEVLPGTGDWLLRDHRLMAWGSSSVPSILWLRGPPGFGKTKLVSILIRELLGESERCENPVPCYFYCVRNTAEIERSTSVAILRSLVRQMATPTTGSIPAPALRAFEARKKDAFAAGPLTSSECVTLMIQIASQRPLTTIVIDALDECDYSSRAELLEFLKQLVEESAGLIKIFISSRNDRSITCHLEGLPNIMVNASDNNTDISRFVEKEIDTMIKNKKLLWGKVSTDLRQSIKDTLCERADGMFRWVSLSLQNLRGLTVERAVRNRLGKLPKDLQKLYEETYDYQIQTGDDEQISIAKDTFRLLLCMENTLHTEEFLNALSFCNEDEEKLRKEDLLEVCFNFIMDDRESDSFRFTHLSVREFLETKEEFDSKSCHLAAAIYCLRCVSAPSLGCRIFPNYPTEEDTKSPVLRRALGDYLPEATVENYSEVEATGVDGGQPDQRYSRPSKDLTCVRYASLLWPYHLALSKTHRLSEPLTSLSHHFMIGDDDLGIAPFHEWSNIMHEDGWRFESFYQDSTDGRPLKEISMPKKGIDGKPIDYDQMIRDSYRWTSTDARPFSRFITAESSPKTDPIFLSCVWSFTDILAARVELDSTSINLESDVPSRAPNSLEKAWWISAEPANRVCAMDLACLYENYDCAKILLEAGATITSHLPLSFAIRAQRVDIVQLLLDHGAPLGRQEHIEMWVQDKEWPTGFGSNPLHQAVIVGSPAILALLLQHGADTTTCIEGISALDLARQNGKVELIRRLTTADSGKITEFTSISSPQDHHEKNYILFGSILGHLSREERLRLYFGLPRLEDTESESTRQDVKALLKSGARGPLFTYSRDHGLLLVVTEYE